MRALFRHDSSATLRNGSGPHRSTAVRVSDTYASPRRRGGMPGVAVYRNNSPVREPTAGAAAAAAAANYDDEYADDDQGFPPEHQHRRQQSASPSPRGVRRRQEQQQPSQQAPASPLAALDEEVTTQLVQGAGQRRPGGEQFDIRLDQSLDSPSQRAELKANQERMRRRFEMRRGMARTGSQSPQRQRQQQQQQMNEFVEGGDAPHALPPHGGVPIKLRGNASRIPGPSLASGVRGTERNGGLRGVPDVDEGKPFYSSPHHNYHKGNDGNGRGGLPPAAASIHQQRQQAAGAPAPPGPDHVRIAPGASQAAAAEAASSKGVGLGANANANAKAATTTTIEAKEKQHQRRQQQRSYLKGGGARAKGVGNKQTICNAISSVCLAGIPNEPRRAEALRAIEAHAASESFGGPGGSGSAPHFAILLLEGITLCYRGVYAQNELGELKRIVGKGPSTLDPANHIEKLYKYSSTGRRFTPLHGR